MTNFLPKNENDSPLKEVYHTQFSAHPKSICHDTLFGQQTIKFDSHLRTKIPTDRFIANRKRSDFNIALTIAHELNENSKSTPEHMTAPNIYKEFVLKKKSFNTGKSRMNGNILKFGHERSCFGDLDINTTPEFPLNFNSDPNPPVPKNTRKISKHPFKVLDAPSLQDDFYLNLVDWSPKNLLAVGLSNSVYLWSANSSEVVKVCEFGDNDLATSVSWSRNRNILAVGSTLGEVQFWDCEKMKRIQSFKGHTGRIGVCAWNGNTIASGSRDKSILVRDIRVSDYSLISSLKGHKQEVCGLKWSCDGQFIASGGNDNKVFVWTSHSKTPLTKFNDHTAAVKALSWSPHQHGILASGGGTADRSIRFWDTKSLTALESIDTGSQVCNLMFSSNSNELVSTHGYSLNQIIVWKYPTKQKLATLTGHSFRVLYLAMNPDGQNIVTGAGDETLRFWNVFPQKGKDKNGPESILSLGNTSLR